MNALQRMSVVVLAAGSALILLTFIVGGATAERLFVFTGLLFPGALIALSGRPAVLPWGVLVPLGLTVLLEACAAVLLFGDLALGVPAFVMLFGMGILPLIGVPLIYAATFRTPRIPPAGVPPSSPPTLPGPRTDAERRA